MSGQPDEKAPVLADTGRLSDSSNDAGDHAKGAQIASDLALESIRELIADGFALCRIPTGAKKPADSGWQLRSAAAEDFTDHNVGIVAGPLSQRVVCVDLDGIDTALADSILPATGMEDGRPGKERTHRWYTLTDTVFSDEVLPGSGSDTRTAMDAGTYPRFPGSRNCRSAIDRTAGVEIKGAGTQAVVPPSLTKTGRRFWQGGVRGEPTPIGYNELLAAVLRLAEAIGWKPAHTTPANTFKAAVLGLADWEILARARAARNASKFRDLWERADASSEDDAALVGMLSFWSTDAVQVERLWMSSPCGLRPKTQERADYRQRTIQFAMGARLADSTRSAPPNGQEAESDVESAALAAIDTRHPYIVAQAFARGFESDGKRLVHHHGRWLSYSGTHYREVDADELRARSYRWLNLRRKPGGEPVAVSQTLVNTVLDGLRSAVHEGGDHLPRWTGTEPRPHPASLIAFRNGLLDVERWLADQSVDLLSHEPSWLSTNVLPFDYTPGATCPHWESFVAEVAAGDDTWMAALAMMFGYLLTHDTAQQKIFLFQGAPRSGKGTICRVLREMLGHANVAGLSLPSLCGEFGLWPLVGKSVAIIPDAHAGRGSDATRVLEVLKSISGEDAMDVNRKHRDQQTMRLPVRFLIACNSMLDLPDPSGALAGRLVLFPFTRSFQGKEDHGLEARLLGELPGILRWSLAGLRALRTDGRLLQPISGEQVRADFARLSSPIRGFIDDRLVIDPAGVVPVSEVFQEWKVWCEQEGHQSGATSTFGAKLLAAAPGINKARLGSREQRQWGYRGIRLHRSGETLGHAWTRGGP